MKVDVNLTLGQMCAEICNRLPPNAQVKITPNHVRVQHTMNCDRLMDASSIDHAFNQNMLVGSETL